MKTEIISIGTEILLGEIADTNSSYLAGQMPPLGITLHWITQVGDERTRLVQALRQAWGRSELTIATGGLGPTEDDLTREAIAQVLGEELRVDPTLVQELRLIFARIGRQMPSHNIKQATLIPSAQAIPNPQGTAPGWWVEREGRIIIAMPGPPREMQYMWEREVAPRLRQRFRGKVIVSRTLKTFGLTEALVDEMVTPLLSSSNPTLGIYAKGDGIHLRLLAQASRPEEAEELLRHSETRLREILGDHIWGTDADTLADVVGRLLAGCGLMLATMESCTGGFLATTLTDTPGSSAYYKGGFVAYSNEVKIALGVPSQLIARYGAISPEVAQAMAQVARERLRADIGVGITGVAGPEELQGQPPGRVHIAIDDGKESKVICGNYPPHGSEVKRRASVAALFRLRQMLLSHSSHLRSC
jgi:nicotinamide-nucleotide amidase